MKQQVPDWLVQLTWFIAGIFATGALWYFISVKNTSLAIGAAAAAVLFCFLAVYLHRLRDHFAQKSAELKNRKDRLHSPILLTVGEERITFDELHRSTEYDVVKVNTDKHFVGVMAEHKWLRHRYPEAQKERQALSSLDRLQQNATDLPESQRIHFDIIDIVFPDGRKKKVYFDISEFFGGITSSKLDPRSTVAMKLRELYGSGRA